jgi:hypothetical protein
VVAVVAAELGVVGLRRAREGGIHIALLLQVGLLGIGIGVHLDVGLERLRRVVAGRRAVLPRRLQRVARRHRLLEMLGHDADAVGQPHGGEHAGHFLDLGVVPALRRAGVHRRVQGGGIDHPGQLHVDRVLRGAVHLERRIAARHGLADEPEVLLGLELLGIDGRQRRRDLAEGRDLAVAQALAVGGIDDGAWLGLQGCGIDAPFLRRVRHQHLAHLGAGGAQVGVVELDRAAADDRHHPLVLERVAVDVGIGRRELDLDLRPVGIHLLGDDERQRGHRALAHLGAGAEHGDGAVRRDPYPRGDLRIGHGVGLGRRDEAHAVDAEREAERHAA